MTITVDVTPTGVQSGVADGQFDRALNELQEEGYEAPISLYENAQLRMQQGKDSSVSRNGNWVREGALYIPGKGNLLTRNSTILSSPVEAVNMHRKGEEFYPTSEQVELALKNSVKLPSESISIPVERFGENEVTVFAFGNGDAKTAQVYGDFLKETKIEREIETMPLLLVNSTYVAKQKDAFERQIWFGGLDSWSYLGGSNRLLGGSSRLLGGSNRPLSCNVRVRGVLHSTGEASLQKISEASDNKKYSTDEILSRLSSKGLSGLANIIRDTF